MTQVVPDVQLVRVETEGPVVTADVFGGDDPVVVGEVVFHVDDPAEHQRVVRTFQEWESEQRLVTLVQGDDGVVTVVDERDAFKKAVES